MKFRTAMSSSIAVLALFLGLNHAVFSQEVSLPRVKETIDTLCSKTMFGRGYVRNGHVHAAKFIASRYKQIGLKDPAKLSIRTKDIMSKDPYLQLFKFDINTFPGVLSMKMGRKEMELGKDYIIAPFSKAGKGRGKVVILDSGRVNDKTYLTEFMAQSFKRKVVMYNESDHNALMNLEENSLEYIEQLYSAKAIIKLKNKKLTASMSTSQYAPPLFETLKDSIDPEVKKIKFNVETELKKQTSQNVLGYIEGSDEPDSFVVFTAHYDHLGGMGDIYFPGANDNAAGIAMLLELAAYYSKPENKPKHSILFIAFSGEEAGLIGSKYYTEHAYFGLNQIKFLVNLDLVGTGSKGATIVNSTRFTEAYDALNEINSENNYLPLLKKRGEAANSDHYFFTKAGVPSFFIYLMGGPPAYHDVYDVPATLPLTKFQETFRLMIEFEGSF